ncbi:hypothetical protein BJ508DRAFT_300338 [Ascobolus immersus RN42]|uniref:Uncharacterized protein n=1 Tax=Ascobolus immersus RN42 TaxID=1160509 RepID=A0A3N4IUN3_ASCIM|nr:hypothetical protein BJ508DRAFT_300338 [Ascobolus immersus RN42]
MGTLKASVAYKDLQAARRIRKTKEILADTGGKNARNKKPTGNGCSTKKQASMMKHQVEQQALTIRNPIHEMDTIPRIQATTEFEKGHHTQAEFRVFTHETGDWKQEHACNSTPLQLWQECIFLEFNTSQTHTNNSGRSITADKKNDRKNLVKKQDRTGTTMSEITPRERLMDTRDEFRLNPTLPITDTGLEEMANLNMAWLALNGDA